MRVTMRKFQTSYVTDPPDDEAWQSVTVETAPVAAITNIALGPCWENARIFVAMSYTEENCQFSKEYVHAIFFDRFIKTKAALRQ
jgi:hypothetical protein